MKRRSFKKPRRDYSGDSPRRNDYSNSGDNSGINADSRNIKKYEMARERYLNMAKEALSYGDRVLSENYLQHADHFLRIINTVEVNVRPRHDYNNGGRQSYGQQNEPQASTPVTTAENNAAPQPGNIAVAPQENTQPEFEKETVNG